MRIKGANFKSHDIHGRQLREEFWKINSDINPQLRIPWIKLQIFRLHLDILISKNAFEKDRFLFYSMYVLRRGRAGFFDLVYHEEDVLFPGVQKIYDDPRTYAAANDGQYCKQYLKSAVHHFAKSPFDRRTSSSRSPNIEALWKVLWAFCPATPIESSPSGFRIAYKTDGAGCALSSCRRSTAA